MPILKIKFNTTGGNNFIIGYRVLGSSNNYTQVSAITSPVQITVPTLTDYDYYVKKICNNQGSESWQVFGVALYNPPCIIPQFTFNSKNANVFKFNYNLQTSQLFFDVEITSPNGTVIGTTRYTAVNAPSPLSITIPSLQNGTYRFRMRGICGADFTDPNLPVSDWTAYNDVNVILTVCTPPSAINPI